MPDEMMKERQKIFTTKSTAREAATKFKISD